MYLFVSLKMTLKWHVELGAPRRHVDVDEHLKLTSCRYYNIPVVIHYTKSDESSIKWTHTHTR